MRWWQKAAQEALQRVDNTTVDGNLAQIGGDVNGSTVVLGDLHQHTGHQVTWPVRHGRIPTLADHYQPRTGLPDLDTAFASDQTLVLTGHDNRQGAVVVSGMGGVGKTQLAAHHAHAAADRTNGVDLLIWITASTRDALITAYADTATHLHAATGATEAQAAADALLNWLTTTTKTWLIVLDDLQLPAHLTGLWPPHTPTGRTLVTTRYRGTALTARGRTTLTVDVFTPTESRAYLTNELADHPHLATDLDELATDLGHLPLALAHAAAYIRDQELPTPTYRRLLADTTRTLPTLFPHPDELTDPHTKTTATTLSLSIPLAEHLAPDTALPLLQLVSLLDPNTIPDTVLSNHHIAEHLATAPDRLRYGLRVLHRLNLLTHDPATTTVRIHALVQRVVRETTEAPTADPDGGTAVLGRVAADALLDVWPKVDTLTDIGVVLRANTTALAGHAEHDLLHPYVHTVLFRAGRSLGDQGLIAAARQHFHRLHELTAAAHGPDHPNTLTTRHNLAYWRGEAGDPAGAVAAYEGLLTDRLRVVGPDHPGTLATRNNLADWRGEAGDSAGAVAAFEGLLTDELRVLGPDHPGTLATRHNLAYWRGEAGDPAGAVAAFKGLLTDQLRVLGPDHPDTLTTRHNLARWRGEAGDPAGAVAAYESLLTDRLRVLGPDHPDTLATRHNLAYWRGEAGDPAGAVTAFKGVLADRLRVLGPDHPDTLATRNNLVHWRSKLDAT
ncbi:tetratricopeptide repeat protein [Actinokineospora pegani]|uniref:tetratricopeptide repeat protein n=1 Tax=Actinokineospora pegani TaxID=2654637 RepID=UPI0012EA502E|nr:tetratricopeptide repeat protein [Actinokineospora pegani]